MVEGEGLQKYRGGGGGASEDLPLQIGGGAEKKHGERWGASGSRGGGAQHIF